MSEKIIEALKKHLEKQPINSSITKLEKSIPGITEVLSTCPGIKLGEKIWNLFNPGKYERFSTCPTCGKETKRFISLTSGYRQFCGNTCASKDPALIEARSAFLKNPENIKNRKTPKGENSPLARRHKEAANILAKYVPGSDKILTIDEIKIIKDKLITIKTNTISTLMLTHPDIFEIIKDCFGRSCSEKLYNALNPGVRNNHLKCHVCETQTDNYVSLERGYRLFCSNKCSMTDEKRKSKAISNFWSDDSKKKRVESLIEHYGTDSMIDVNRKKAVATMQKNYGVDYPGQSKACRDKAKAVVIEKYGVDNVWKDPEVKQRCADTLFERYGVNSPLELVDWSKINVTKWQTDINFILEELGIVTILNDRTLITPYEIDIYCPELKIGIELNGLYWHTENKGKNSSYHLLKQQQCENLGIKLIQIFEDEWFNQKEIVIGRLLAILGKAEKIYARKCTVEKIKYKEAVPFMQDTHIQGMVSGSHNIGLKIDGELVALLVMGSPRFNKKYDWELLRYSSKTGIVVVGGASRLLTSFLKDNPGSVISYADRRWSQGNLYKILGFKEINRTAPSPSYVDVKTLNRISVYKVRGSKIKRYVPEDIYDSRLTEEANMQLAGFERIFDCGSLVFTKD